MVLELSLIPTFQARSGARLETGDARYEWVNRTLFIGRGKRLLQSVVLDLYNIE